MSSPIGIGLADPILIVLSVKFITIGVSDPDGKLNRNGAAEIVPTISSTFFHAGTSLSVKSSVIGRSSYVSSDSNNNLSSGVVDCSASIISVALITILL